MAISRAGCFAVAALFLSGTFVLVWWLVQFNESGSTLSDNSVPYFTNQCGVPDSWCNRSDIVYPARCPFPPFVQDNTTLVDNGRTYWVTTFNKTICPLTNTYLLLSARINLGNGIACPTPDNYTLAAPTRFSDAVRAVLPGATTTLSNTSFICPAFTQVTVTAQLTNLTMFQAQKVFFALQYASFQTFFDSPVSIQTWNSTGGFPVVTNVINICGVNTNQTCPINQFCANWRSNAVCMCNFPQSVRYPQSNDCVPNPCYPGNGGCGPNLKCVPNFGATLQRDCVAPV